MGTKKGNAQERYKAEEMITAIQKAEGNVSMAAKILGCNRNTVMNYINKYPTIKVELDQQREKAGDQLELTAQMLARGVRKKDATGRATNEWETPPNPTMLIFLLKTRYKDRGYVERVEIAGNLNLNVINDAVRALEEAGLEPAEVFEKIIQRARAESEIKRDANSG